VLARDFDFDGALLARAVRATFDRRKTTLPTTTPVALTPAFAEDATKKTQWSGFVRMKAGVRDAGSLAETIADVRAFVEAPASAANGPPRLDVASRRGVGREGSLPRPEPARNVLQPVAHDRHPPPERSSSRGLVKSACSSADHRGSPREGINELRVLQALISRMRSHERLDDIVGGRGINRPSS
jgi:hypothetical protein